jgi:hypothetical protein
LKKIAKAMPVLMLVFSAAGIPIAASASAQAIPQVNYRAGYVTLTNSSGQISQRNECSYRGGSMSPPKYIANGCSTRVWMYQNSNDSGYSLCVNPRSSTGALGRSYRSYWVSNNSQNC